MSLKFWKAEAEGPLEIRRLRPDLITQLWGWGWITKHLEIDFRIKEERGNINKQNYGGTLVAISPLDSRVLGIQPRVCASVPPLGHIPKV